MSSPLIFHVSNHSELLKALGSVSKPADGRVRVYRGQPKRYFLDQEERVDSIIPRAMRSTTRFDSVWHTASKRLAKHLKSVAPKGTLLPLYPSLAQILSAAILQHYGEGSALLDVTRSLHTALWFSRHKLKDDRTGLRLYKDGERMLNLKVISHWYEPAETQTAVVYVFDVRPWLPTDVIEHGHLIDILDPLFGISEVIGTSARIEVQEGSLLAAALSGISSSEHGGALAGTQDAVAIPYGSGPQDNNLLDECVAICVLDKPFPTPGDARNTSDLFPLPTRDPVYRMLLQIPTTPTDLAIDLKTDREFVDTIERPVDIPEYYSRKPPHIEPVGTGWPGFYDELKSYADLDQRPVPPLFLTWLLEQNEEMREVEFNGDFFSVDDTLPILLQSACWWLTPTPKSKQWDLSVLTGPSFIDWDNPKYQNVFIELSSLDLWDPDNKGPTIAVRAIWMLKKGDKYYVSIFRTHVDQGERSHSRHSTPIEFVRSKTQFEPHAPDIPEVFTFEALHGLLMVLLVLSALTPGKTEEIRIPVEGGKTIVSEHTIQPALLHKWGRHYHLPYFAGGVPFAPGLRFFEHTEVRLEP